MAARLLLLLLLAVAAALSLLAASPVHAGLPSRDFPPAAPRVDDVLLNASRLIPPNLDSIVVAGAVDPGTVYDITVVFRATRRVGPPRLQYAVVAAADDDAADASTTADAIFIVVGMLLIALCIGVFIFIAKRYGGDDSGDAIPKKSAGGLALAQGGVKA